MKDLPDIWMLCVDSRPIAAYINREDAREEGEIRCRTEGGAGIWHIRQYRSVIAKSPKIPVFKSRTEQFK